MSDERITADDALEALVDAIEACQLSSKKRVDRRSKLKVLDLTDQDGALGQSKSRTFGWYVLSQGASPWCFGGETIEVHVKIVYQNEVIYQDLVDLKNHLEYGSTPAAGIAHYHVGDYSTFMENNDVGEPVIYVYQPISIDYKPPNLQNE